MSSPNWFVRVGAHDHFGQEAELGRQLGSDEQVEFASAEAGVTRNAERVLKILGDRSLVQIDMEETPEVEGGAVWKSPSCGRDPRLRPVRQPLGS